MDDDMTEKKNSVFELEKEEMARVSGGGLPYEPAEPIKKDPRLIEQPHCRLCRLKVDSYEGSYKCITKGCDNEGHILNPQDMVWF